jgi:L-ascorbate metabolism protein UlaG (beta-lactamase superfamily)
MGVVDSSLAVTWWGHASVTVEIGGVRIGVDPLLSDRLIHLRRRGASPGGGASQADVVLISHLHGDHLHVPSLRRFGPGLTLVLPKGGEPVVKSLADPDLRPVVPGDVVEVAGARIEVLEAAHDGTRSGKVPSRISGPALGFRVEAGGRSFWFPGDTELHEAMSRVAPVDLALVPIGGWGPTLGDGHMSPEHGAESVARVGATWSIPVHWGTFWPVGLERLMPRNHHNLFVTPGDRFVEAVRDQHVATEVVMPAPGERVVLA